MKSTEIMQMGLAIQQERAKEYNSPEGERSMERIVAAFNAATGHKLSESHGWLFMVMLKIVRSESAPEHADSAVDGTNYMSLYGEAQLKQKPAVDTSNPADRRREAVDACVRVKAIYGVEVARAVTKKFGRSYKLTDMHATHFDAVIEICELLIALHSMFPVGSDGSFDILKLAVARVLVESQYSKLSDVKPMCTEREFINPHDIAP